MTIRFRADGTTGKVAIWDGTDDAPFTSPLSHIDRLHFHSDLPAIKVQSVHTGTVTLAACDSGTQALSGNYLVSVFETKTLFAHGISGTPYVEGKITTIDGGANVIPLCGSVPLQQQTNWAGLPRWVNLAADSTNVVLTAFVVGSVACDYPSIVLGYEVYVTDLVL